MANEIVRQTELFESSKDDRIIIDAKPHYTSDFDHPMYRIQIIREDGRYFAIHQQFCEGRLMKYEILKTTAIGIFQRPCSAYEIIRRYCELMYELEERQA